MKYSEFIQNSIIELNQISEIIQEEFYHLSENQLNWKPNQKSWSILQCLNHLILSDSMYDETFEKILKKYSPQSKDQEVKFSWIGKWLINAVNPNHHTPIPAPKKFQVSNDFLKKNETFSTYNSRLEKLTQYFENFKGLDLNQIYLSSPALWILRFNLSSCIQIMTYHHQRHLLQCMKIKRNTQFPMDF